MLVILQLERALQSMIWGMLRFIEFGLLRAGSQSSAVVLNIFPSHLRE
jgi:hypothetical protein